MGRKLLKTVQTITTFRNPLADPVGTRRGPPLVRGPQFENRCSMEERRNRADLIGFQNGPWFFCYTINRYVSDSTIRT